MPKIQILSNDEESSMADIPIGRDILTFFKTKSENGLRSISYPNIARHFTSQYTNDEISTAVTELTAQNFLSYIVRVNSDSNVRTYYYSLRPCIEKQKCEDLQDAFTTIKTQLEAMKEYLQKINVVEQLKKEEQAQEEPSSEETDDSKEQTPVQHAPKTLRALILQFFQEQEAVGMHTLSYKAIQDHFGGSFADDAVSTEILSMKRENYLSCHKNGNFGPWYYSRTPRGDVLQITDMLKTMAILEEQMKRFSNMLYIEADATPEE